MDDAERTRLDLWMERKWQHGPCPVCHADDWSPQPKLGQIENLADSPPFGLKTGRVPVLLVTCQNCGYFLTVNALTAGIRQLPNS